MSSSNQRPANRGFRSVLRCAITHYRQAPWLSAPEPRRSHRFKRSRSSGRNWKSVVVCMTTTAPGIPLLVQVFYAWHTRCIMPLARVRRAGGEPADSRDVPVDGHVC